PALDVSVLDLLLELAQRRVEGRGVTTVGLARLSGRHGGTRLGLGELALQAVELAPERRLARLRFAELQLGRLHPLGVDLATLGLLGPGVSVRGAPRAGVDLRLVGPSDELLERRLDRRQRRRS